MNILIIGGGKVGGRLAGLLAAGSQRVTLIEARPDHEARLRRALPGVMVVAGDGADPAVLEAAGVRGAQVVAAVTGADETNLVVTSLARLEFDVPRTVARVNDPRNTWLFTPEMGVDVALNQADMIAGQIAYELGAP